MPKIIKTQREVFDRTISPVLDKLLRLCDKNGISMQFTAQIEADTTNTIVTQSLYTDKSNQLFRVIDRLSKGLLNVIELPDGDFYLRTANLEDEAAHDRALLSKLPFVVPFSGIIH